MKLEENVSWSHEVFYTFLNSSLLYFQIIDEKSLIKKYQREISNLKQELDQLKRGMLAGVSHEEIMNLRQQVLCFLRSWLVAQLLFSEYYFTLLILVPLNSWKKVKWKCNQDWRRKKKLKLLSWVGFSGWLNSYLSLPRIPFLDVWVTFLVIKGTNLLLMMWVFFISFLQHTYAHSHFFSCDCHCHHKCEELTISVLRRSKMSDLILRLSCPAHETFYSQWRESIFPYIFSTAIVIITIIIINFFGEEIIKYY